jgi:hypothetical protein
VTSEGETYVEKERANKKRETHTSAEVRITVSARGRFSVFGLLA